jgi:hypothetical protein
VQKEVGLRSGKKTSLSNQYFFFRLIVEQMQLLGAAAIDPINRPFFVLPLETQRLLGFERKLGTQ